MPKPDEAEETKDVRPEDAIQSVVETANAEDETAKEDEHEDDEVDESAEDDSEEKDSEDSAEDSEEESDEEETEDDESEEEKEAEVERKFKNLADPDDGKYIVNLEKAYENSSAEAIRLNSELKQANEKTQQLIATLNANPELAKQVNEAVEGRAPAPTQDPFLVNAKAEWESKSKQEVQEIVEQYPEVVSDPVVNEKVKHWMSVFSREAFEGEQKMLSGGEAMTMALKHLGVMKDNPTPSVKDKVKKTGAPARPKAARKSKTPTKQVSSEAYRFGELMGVSKESVEKYA